MIEVKEIGKSLGFVVYFIHLFQHLIILIDFVFECFLEMFPLFAFAWIVFQLLHGIVIEHAFDYYCNAVLRIRAAYVRAAESI